MGSSRHRARRRRCTSTRRITASVLLSFLTLVPSAAAWGFEAQAPLLPDIQPSNVEISTLSAQSFNDEFTLRHVFHRGGERYPRLHRRLDVNPNRIKAAVQGSIDGEEHGIGPYTARASTIRLPRLQKHFAHDLDSMLDAAQMSGETVSFPDDAWTIDEVLSPNISDKATVINFALMAGSAYNKDKEDPEWEDVRPPFNVSFDVGWEQDGLRGHVFANKDNTTIVLSIKGTTSAVFDGAGTTTNDKLNDNLFAGCCCGQGGHYWWKSVCDCMVSAYTCNDTCIVQQMNRPSRYYMASRELFGNVTDRYPKAKNIWLTGHSLGGLVTGLLGLHKHVPVITFEAVPQALAADRLGLPIPPGYKTLMDSRREGGLWNFGHNGDPVYEGACNSLTSACTIGGYALESQCHAGMRCVYDTVGKWGWGLSMLNHSIRKCISNVYREWDGVPKCEPENSECADCGLWERIRSNGSEITTTRSSTSTSTTIHRTRTETCKTPGWWGCLDSSTTEAGSSTTSTSIFTTETCASYGWFGNCLDRENTTVTSRRTMTVPTVTTTSSTSNVPTTTCETPGWFGCKDRTTTTTATTKNRHPHTHSTVKATSSVEECATPGFFWGCRDRDGSVKDPVTTTVTALDHEITEARWHDVIL